jgi:hypothetical protein
LVCGLFRAPVYLPLFPATLPTFPLDICYTPRCVAGAAVAGVAPHCTLRLFVAGAQHLRLPLRCGGLPHDRARLPGAFSAYSTTILRTTLLDLFFFACYILS